MSQIKILSEDFYLTNSPSVFFQDSFRLYIYENLKEEEELILFDSS